MPYLAQISRTNPTCFLFLIDQSASMSQSFGTESGKTKADGVADAINRLLQSLVFRCTKGEAVLDRFHVGVLGYGSKVGPAWKGPLAGQKLVSVSQLNEHPLRIDERVRKVDDGAGGILQQKTKFPIWFEPVADGKTPMCQALQQAHDIVKEFLGRQPHCFPPMVINITDGKANDGDPEVPAKRLCELASSDGNVLLFNLHLSRLKDKPIEFPTTEAGLPNDYAKQLYRMSSPLPPFIRTQAAGDFHVPEGARGFVFNADLVTVIQFLDIGTRVGFTILVP